MQAVGIVANPVSGKDVRRLLTNAGTSSLAEKVGVVRRLLVGAHEAGARRFLVLGESHGIVRKACATLALGDDVEVVEAGPLRHHDERDTVAAARAMGEARCAVVVALGGDGTSRAVALGWPSVPLLAISTGTNNAFPVAVEATSAGAAAGLLAVGAVRLDEVATAAKVVRVTVEDEPDDLALVDAVLLREPPGRLGSLAPFDPAAIEVAVLTRAEPAAVGVSSIGAVVAPLGVGDDAGLLLRLGAGGDAARVPLAPGTYGDVIVAEHRRLALGEEVEVVGPGILAFDGDRRRRLAPGQRAALRVVRDGPRVVDVARTLASPAARAAWRR